MTDPKPTFPRINGAFPYGDPIPATLTLVEPGIRDLVKRINESGKYWTVQSCEGHPFPMLELLIPVESVVSVFQKLSGAMTESQQLFVTFVQRFEGFERWRFELFALHLKERANALRVLNALAPIA